MANVVLVTKGTGGDLIPLLGIGSAAKKRGHHVMVCTHCRYADVARQAGLDFVALDTPEEFERFIGDGPLLNSPKGIPVFFQRHVLAGLLSEYERIWEQCDSGQTILVALHRTDLAARMVAEKLQIPLVRVFTAVAQITTLSLLGTLHQLFASDLNHIRAKVGLPSVSDWQIWLQYPRSSVATWPDWFAAPDSGWAPGILPVGFVNHDESETGKIAPEVQEILDGGEPPILITGGMGSFLGREFYAVSMEACRLLGRQGILVTQYPDLVPQCLPEGIKWFARLPFASIMPHVGVVIHHGGTSTLARAIAAGVPQLALPFGGDRPDTASRLQQLGVAEFLLPPRWQPNLVAEAVCRLENSSGVQQRCRELAQRVCGADSATVACGVIEEVITKSFKVGLDAAGAGKESLDV